jgi:hypothetical protein
MPNACSTCQHYNPTTASIRNEAVGECRARPPMSNYSFTKVRAVDWCSEWRPAPRIPKTAGELFPLDTQTASGAALPPTARLVAEGSSAGTRPRRSTTAPAVTANAPAVPEAI